MKIGIVSRVHGINYGANLQAFALQKALEILGHDVQYINYNVLISTKGIRRILSAGYGLIRNFLGYTKRKKATLNFRNNIHFTQPLHNITDINRECCKFDMLMAGSDQIWNPRYYKSSHGLYLFENIGSGIPKVSYASSIGVSELNETYIKKLKDTLVDFRKVSCRENAGVKLLSEIGFDANRMIDPTFLLTEKEWKESINVEPIIKGEYILCYVMPGVEPLNSYIIRLAEKIRNDNIPIGRIVVMGDKEYKGLFSKHLYNRTAGPAEFLNILYNAKFVLTSSFHGTCFSVIFRKQFCAILDPSNKFNSRIIDLLNNLNLSSQIHYMEAQVVSPNIYIKYNLIDPLIEKERENAISYLSSLNSI